MADFRFSLPWPPTNNTYYRRVGAKTLISARGRNYALLVAKEMQERDLAHYLIPYSVSLKIVYFEPDKRVRDIDGLQKGLFDSLTKCGFWRDDRQVKHVDMELVEKGDHSVVGGGVYIEVSRYVKIFRRSNR